jgi:hypothetical protein
MAIRAGIKVREQGKNTQRRSTGSTNVWKERGKQKRV